MKNLSSLGIFLNRIIKSIFLFLYKKKVYCGIKCLGHNKFKFVYKNLLKHRIKKFDNYDAFRNYYYNNRAKMILSIKKDKGIYD